MTKKNSSWFVSTATSVLTLFAITQNAMLSSQSLQGPWLEAVKAAQSHDFMAAVKGVDAAIAAGLTQPALFYHRGRWNFQAGDMQASLADFDRYLKTTPSRSNSLWERGITCYYAGEFKAGVRQFDDYQQYHNNDVENAVWKYLCQLPIDGNEKARSGILPIRNDTRIPMMEVYRLFRGESNPKQVMEVLSASRSTGEQHKHETFDAHLYLALFYDAEDDLANAKKHVDLAVKQFEKGDYMWSVAVEHQRHLKRRAEEKAAKTVGGE